MVTLFSEVPAEVREAMECLSMDLPLLAPPLPSTASSNSRVEEALEGPPQWSVDAMKKGLPGFRRRNSVFKAVL